MSTDEILKGLRRQGELADRLLKAAGVVLTQGGEPTFLPEDTTAPEWNLEALGPDKLFRAWRLCVELERTLLPGGFILKGNGKLYPGEPIPRWKLTLLRRSGSIPLWKNPALLFHGGAGGGEGEERDSEERADGRQPASPRGFLSALSVKLGLRGYLQPAYEDIEAALRHAAASGEAVPVPRYSRKSRKFLLPRWTGEERARWESFHRTAGWVLPLGREGGRWISDRWKLPGDEDIRLLPGNSSIGLRLPLNRLPSGSLSCALTSETGDGRLHLFLPPLPDAESFAELLALIEETAEDLHLPSRTLLIEGAEPPREADWESLTIIPDPGVIEVNLPPASNWNAIETTVTALYEAAERAGLRGIRVLASGERVATGGGGHLVLGGPSLEENPFLLKPSLLPGFLRFLQRHPSLSYLFSGRFLGPSSQAPRVDESLFEIPRELERTLRNLESLAPPASPGHVDFQLRNLLLDLHGNTHKAEVSVDKFFNPFLPNGRLGLVEFRAIEMSHDIPSFLAVHALWRALAASLVTTPFREPLIDWKEHLHGEFLTPSRMMEDLGQVLDYLNDTGFSFRIEWFEPHGQFRFPVLHESIDPVPWSLRRAAEPWPLLGEQPSPSGGVIRCVDSSTERFEITLASDSGISVTVNGRPLPLRPLPGGQWSGSVRFRGLDLPVRLHPQIHPHLPLAIVIRPPGGKDAVRWTYDRSPDGLTYRITRDPTADAGKGMDITGDGTVETFTGSGPLDLLDGL